MIHPSTIFPPKPPRNGMAGVALCRGFPIPADAAQGICDGTGAVRGVLVERSCFADTPTFPLVQNFQRNSCINCIWQWSVERSFFFLEYVGQISCEFPWTLNLHKQQTWMGALRGSSRLWWAYDWREGGAQPKGNVGNTVENRCVSCNNWVFSGTCHAKIWCPKSWGVKLWNQQFTLWRRV